MKSQMINITNKQTCCGCGACVQKCPKQCMTLMEDNQGFLYPLVDMASCIDCGLCEKVCPFLNPADSRKPIQTLAAVNKNEEIRMKSSSGGIFTLLAEKIIDEGGVVFGARFDDEWQVTLDFTETKEGLAAFRGSKYVQARTGETYNSCEQFLKEGRKVLYSGTSCQIAGLKKFLRKEYDNLLAVEIVCHGVPSSKVWKNYIETIIRPKGVAGKNTVSSSLNVKSVITDISFRDKGFGWKKYGFVIRGKSASKADKNSVSSSVNTNNIIIQEPFSDNLYMKTFLKNLCLRPSCYDCQVKSGRSGADIALADFWGYDLLQERLWNDDKGVSLVLAYTAHGKKVLHLIQNQREETYEYALKYNSAIEHCVARNQYVDQFWQMFELNGFKDINKLLSNFEPSFMARLQGWIKRKIKR